MRYRRRSNISLTGHVRTTNLTVIGVTGAKVSKAITYADIAEMTTMGTMTNPYNTGSDAPIGGLNIQSNIQTSIINSVGATFQGDYDTNYIDFKLGFVENFLKPLIKKDYDNLWRNYYNYEFIDAKLDHFREGADSDAFKDDIDLMKIIVSATRMIAIKHENINNALDHSIDQDNHTTAMQSIIELPRLILEAPFEIYVNLFGMPNFKENEEFDKDLVDEIQIILDANKGILFDDVKEYMIKYSYRFRENMYDEKTGQATKAAAEGIERRRIEKAKELARMAEEARVNPTMKSWDSRA